MTKLVGLDNLVRLSPSSGHDADRILYGYSRYLRISQSHKEINARLLATIGYLRLEVTCTAHRKMSTGGESDKHIPAHVQHLKHIALEVVACTL